MSKTQNEKDEPAFKVYCHECPHLLDDHNASGCLDPDCHCDLPEGIQDPEDW